MSNGPQQQTRAAPAPIPFDVATELCRVAERLSDQQEEIPLLPGAVEANTGRIDTMAKLLQDLILEIRALRQAVERNTDAVTQGRTALTENTVAVRGRASGGIP